MPALPGNSYDAVVTSPPYCNRYDYTRTYALELALLGIGEDEISKLRQEMLSCTVENRAGFVALALEKNRRATPFVEQARSLKAAASQAKTPRGFA